MNHFNQFLNPKYDIEHSVKLQDGLSKKLITELTKFTPKGQPASTASKTTNESSIVYELYYTPEQKQQLAAQKMADVEKRVSELENLLGKATQVQSVISSGGLIHNVDEMSEKLKLLTNPNQLESLQRKLKTIAQDMEALSEKAKANPQQQPYEKKVDELFTLMSKWDVSAQQLPAIVSRMQSLKVLHEESASFHQSAVQLDTQQQEMKKLLKNNSELMSQLEKNFAGNVSVIQNNVTSLEKRFTALAKKLEELGMETF